ncbi:Site-specific DNA-methyltransferase (fragment) [uncultured Defluviicoccus sp.]|uniref:Site-specific DNA-methyltransferase n=1 Tax=metagenome TaxID=256318 RepID=A0A380TLC4_9ZZZZ
MQTIIHGDCLKYLRALPDQSISLILTDPPYGLGIAKKGQIGSGKRFTPKRWDVLPPREVFAEMRRVSRHQVIWGGNYFTHYLPPSRCWLVWYKKDGLPKNSFADCELAWTSFNRNAAVFNCRWSGFVKDSREPRVAHPTQKALEVMKWCVAEFSQPGDTILDPFLGSGTTAVAAKLLLRRFTGIEIDREYVAIAHKRLAEAA